MSCPSRLFLLSLKNTVFVSHSKQKQNQKEQKPKKQQNNLYGWGMPHPYFSMKPLSKNVIIAILAILVISVIFSNYTIKNDKPEQVNLAKVVEQIQAGSVSAIDIEGTD